MRGAESAAVDIGQILDIALAVREDQVEDFFAVDLPPRTFELFTIRP